MQPKRILFLLVVVICAAFKWPPKIWPPTDLPDPIRYKDNPALLQALAPVMRSGTEGATHVEEMTWLGEMPDEFYEDLVPSEVLEACEAAGPGKYCMIQLGKCMSLRYGVDDKFVVWNPVACQSSAKTSLCEDSGECTNIALKE
jgi:hypothetical protein